MLFVSGPAFVLSILTPELYFLFKVGGIEAYKNPGPSCFGLCSREPLPRPPGGV